MKKPQTEIVTSHRSSYVSKLVASKLLTAPIFGALENIPNGVDLRFLTLAIGHTNMISGCLDVREGRQVGYVNHFNVANGLQGYGIGKRLFKAFVAECKDIGAEELWSYSVSEKALLLRRQLFGDAGLHFYDDEHEEAGILPMTFEQAVSTDRRIDEIYTANPERQDLGYIGLFLDLTQVDTTGWERPHPAHLYVNAE
jgi:hypothetical protein